MGASNPERQLRKRNEPVVEAKCTLQVGVYVVGNVVPSQLGLALASHTERVNLPLYLFGCEVRPRHLKIACQPQAFGKVGLAGRKVKLRLQMNQAGHDRGIGPYRQLQQVFDLPVFNHHVQDDSMPIGVCCPYHRAVCHQPRLQNFRFYRLKVCVASGSVDNGVKLRMQGHHPAGGRNAKIWSIGFAIHDNVVESTAILSGGRQYPGNALDRPQIRVAKKIVAAYRSVARAVCLPGAKRSTGKHVPHRLGIGQVRVKVHGSVGPDARHFQTLDVKFKWQLPWFERIDYQLCLVADEAIDEDLYRSPLGPHVSHLRALLSGRQIQPQSFYIDRLDMHGRAKKILDSHTKPEFCNSDERLHSGLVIVGVTVSKKSELFTRDLESLNQRDIKCVEFNFAFEASRQSLNHTCAQDGSGVKDQNAHYGDRDYEQQRDSDDPVPTGDQLLRPVRVWLAF